MFHFFKSLRDVKIENPNPSEDMVEDNLRKADFKRAAQEALKILNDNCITDPPIPILELAENAGLTVYVAEFDDKEVAGLLEFKEKNIVVNTYDSFERQAFTIAHELGHWILHEKELAKDKNVNIVYRKPLGDEKDWLEQEANWFAANLLVPMEMLQRFPSEDVNVLARAFRVSTAVIGYRKRLLNG